MAIFDLSDPKTSVQTRFADPIVEEAREFWDRCNVVESQFRIRFLDDIRFAWGDSDNGYQWPNAIRRARDVDARPCLTMNVIRQHNNQITNEGRRNKSSPKVMATGGGASASSAKVMSDIFRHIENVSKAQDAYTLAREFQVDGGIGWWRLITDWTSPDSWDQDILIQPVLDPLSVFFDPDIKHKDGSDGKKAIVFDNVPKDQFKEAYPKIALLAGDTPLGIGSTYDDWVTKDYVRIAEYFRIVYKPDTLVSFVYQGERKTIRKSWLKEGMLEVLDHPLTKVRPIELPTVEWKLIVGERVIDETDWLGKYIPLVRCVGREMKIGGRVDRTGHTRQMKDAQRMYNYNASAQVEFVALQSKTPWVVAAKAIEGHESLWNTANLVNHSVLTYNHVDDDNPEAVVPPPQRQEPPNAAPAYEAGMTTSFNQMMMVSGQWQNQMGMMGNERTGAAISERQEQGDTATFHFQDNFDSALLFTATQILDLVPKIYDSKRMMMILCEDETQVELQIDPTASQALQEIMNENGEVITRILNPRIGQYDLAPKVGPAYGTRREETVKALTLLLTEAPALVGLIGDLLLGSMDFDKADEAAMRLKRMVPPQALGQGPSQQEQALQQQLQTLSMALTKSLQQQGKESLKLVGKNQMRDIDAYKAETDRFKALQEALAVSPEEQRKLVQQLIDDALATSMKPIVQANEDDIDTTPRPSEQDEDETGGASGAPLENARQAPDGQWYLQDPTRKGKYLHIGGLAQEKGPGPSGKLSPGELAMLAHRGVPLHEIASAKKTGSNIVSGAGKRLA